MTMRDIYIFYLSIWAIGPRHGYSFRWSCNNLHIDHQKTVIIISSIVMCMCTSNNLSYTIGIPAAIAVSVSAA